MSFEKQGESSTSKHLETPPVYYDTKHAPRPASLAPSYRSVWSLRSLRPRSLAPSYRTVDPFAPDEKSPENLDAVPEEDEEGGHGASSLVRTFSNALNFAERGRQKQALDLANKKQSELLQALDSRDHWKLERLLKTGYDPNALLYSGRAVPSYSKRKAEAAIPVYLEVTKKNWRAKGKKIQLPLSKRDVAGDMPLYRAVFNKHVKAVEILLEYGARVDSRDYLGESALIRASREGLSEIIKVLLKAGADVDEREYHDATPLMNAVTSRYVQAAKVLLEAGADVNAEDAGGRTALMNAAGSDCPEIVKLLLENGADVNAVTNEGHTALDSAILVLFSRGLQRSKVTDLLLAERDGRPIEEVEKQAVKIDALSGYSRVQFTNMDPEFAVASDCMEKHAG